ncbi:hypothetical protein EPO05_03225 [Patescibacteria group bacterium]|nr:MAG: hypothetical protein EPO05_03225 [Patescibacteria group bacterium]
MAIFEKEPIFIPKLQDQKIFEAGFSFPAVLMDASHVIWRPKAAKKVKESAGVFIVDPSTHCMLFNEAKGKENFKKLSYPADVQPEKIYSDSSFRRENVIIPAVDNQVKMGADIIIAPYFFAMDTDDIKFGINISMIAETIRYVEEKGIDKPIFVKIQIGNNVLCRPSIVNYIVDRYRDDFSDKIGGYFISFDELDCKNATEDTLGGLAYMSFQLSEGKNVIIQRIGPFGEIISSIGLTGFSSGLGDGESLVVKNLEKSPQGWSNKVKKTYIPEVFDKVNDEIVKKIGYKCSCAACQGSFPVGEQAKKQHFVHRKMEIMDALSKLDRPQKIALMEEKLTKAIKLAETYNRKFAIDLKTIHLKRWLNVLQLAKNWSYEKDDDELDKLLQDLEK